ncbi:MAG: S41 family peptidase [Bacteroidales bacterium]|nr:S41 family peptidase [Bacteroidales bacterium]
MNKVKVTAIIVVAVLVAALAGWLLLSRVAPRFGIYLFPPSPQRYAELALDKMENGIYASGEEWNRARSVALAEVESCRSYEETHDVLRRALAVAGGKHSALLTPESLQSAAQEQLLPTVEVDGDGILMVTIPPYSSSSSMAHEYADKVLAALKERQYAGIVVDLRDNVGGDMGPMLAALSPLLPDGQLMAFNINGRQRPVMLDGGHVAGGGTPMTVEDFKVEGVRMAVLQNGQTGSSGEMTLLAFRGLGMARTFGEPSAGYCSCNDLFRLYDGCVMQLTTGTVRARTGEEFCEDPIAPDVLSDNPVAAAKAWILSAD